MGIIDKIFGRGGTGDVDMAGWLRDAEMLNALNNQILASGLPTINPDGYDYIGAQKRIAPVYDATDIIIQKVIASPIVTYRVKDKAKLERSKRIEKTNPMGAYVLKQSSLEEVTDLGLNTLLASPNPYMTQKQFVWSLGLMYLLQGNAYVYGSKSDSGKVLEMYPISNMQIVVNSADQFNPILGYRMMYGNNISVPFRKEQIYHIKGGNPAYIDSTFDYLYGVSPLRPHLETMRTIEEANKQASKQVKNGGVFGLLSPKVKDDEFSAPQKEQLMEKMRMARNSNDELARVFPSSIAMDWKQIGLSSADLQLLDLMSEKCKAIFRTYHVPEQFASSDSSSYNNLSTAVRQLVYDAVAPLCGVISEMLTNFVGVGYGDIIVELDYTQLPEMMADMADMTGSLVELVNAGIISRDEAREALRYGSTGLDSMTSFGELPPKTD